MFVAKNTELWLVVQRGYFRRNKNLLALSIFYDRITFKPQRAAFGHRFGRTAMSLDNIGLACHYFMREVRHDVRPSRDG